MVHDEQRHFLVTRLFDPNSAGRTPALSRHTPSVALAGGAASGSGLQPTADRQHFSCFQAGGGAAQKQENRLMPMLLQVIPPAAGAKGRCLGPSQFGGVMPGDLLASGTSTRTRSMSLSALAVSPRRAASSAFWRSFCARLKFAACWSAVEQAESISKTIRLKRRRR